MRRTIVSCLLAFFPAIGAIAAEPNEQAIRADGDHSATYAGGPYPAPNVSYAEGSSPTCDDSGQNDCDEMALDVIVPDDSWRVVVELSWTPQAADLDLEVDDADGTEVASSGNIPGLAESAAFNVSKGAARYTIRVVPYSGGVESAEIVARLEKRETGALGSCDFNGAPTPTTAIASGVADALRGAGPDTELGAFVHFSMGSRDAQDALIANAGLRPVVDFREYARSVFVHGPAAGFVELAKRPEVAYLETNRRIDYLGETASWATNVRVAQEPVSGGPYLDGQGRILDGSGVAVSVLDSGVNALHPDFAGRVLHNYKITGDFTGGAPATFIDVGEGDSDTTSGHGTHVAGTVLGSGAQSTADYPVDAARPNVPGTFAGAAPNASLVAYSVGDVIEPVGVVPAALLLWIDHGLQHLLFNLDRIQPRPRVASLSLGDPGGSDYNAGDTSSCLVKGLVEEGVSVVFAAGNDGGDGQGGDDLTSSFCKDPTPGVICVASYDDAGTGRKDASLSSFSSRGLESDPASYPDITAPGSNMTSTCMEGVQGQITCSILPETRWAPFYGTISGTSMATPHVSGAISLLYQADPDLTPAEVEDLLQDTARKVGTNGAYIPDPQNQAGDPAYRRAVDSPAGTTNFGFGAGLLDVQAALDELAERQSAAIDAGALTEQTFSSSEMPAASSVTPIIGGDEDVALAGAADVLSLSMSEYADGDAAGVEYRIGLRDAADSGAHAAGLDYSVEQFVNGVPQTVTVRLAGGEAQMVQGSAGMVAVDGNELVMRVPQSELGHPSVGAPIHNIRVLSSDAQSGAVVDFAPSTENAPGELADARPAYGRPFTIATDHEGGVDPRVACTAPGRTILTDARGDIFALTDGQPENPAVPFYDLRELSIIQPEHTDGSDYRITFRLKMEGFPIVPSGTWPVNFCSPAFPCEEPDSNTKPYGDDNKYYTVEMTTLPDQGGSPDAPVFQIRQPTASGDTTGSRTVIPAASGSVDSDGTIKIEVMASDIGLTAAGAGSEDLTKFQSRVTPAATTPDNMPDALVGAGTYRTLAAGFCSSESNHPPTASAKNIAPDEGSTAEFFLQATDPDTGDQLTYSIETGPSAGSIESINSSTGEVRYAAPFVEGESTDSFTFRVEDGNGGSDTATVEITINETDADNDGIDDDDEADGCVNDPDPSCGGGEPNSGTLDAELRVSTTSGSLTASFDASDSHYEENADPIHEPEYKFVFGDGQETPFQGSAVMDHTYDAAGQYTAYVIVRDGNGESAVSEDVPFELAYQISVGPDGGENASRFTIDNASGEAPLEVTFDASPTVTADGWEITSYAWDFAFDESEGFTADASGQVVTHVYTEAGDYTPKLQVTYTQTETGETQTKSASAVVKATAPGANPPQPTNGTSAGGGSLGWLLLGPLALVGIRRRIG